MNSPPPSPTSASPTSDVTSSSSSEFKGASTLTVDLSEPPLVSSSLEPPQTPSRRSTPIALVREQSPTASSLTDMLLTSSPNQPSPTYPRRSLSPSLTSLTITTHHRISLASCPELPPVMGVLSDSATYTLEVTLPHDILPEMVTISANRGDKLRIVANAWHIEAECHFEWLVSFPPLDVDMKSVHARFDPDGRLSIQLKKTPPVL